MSDGQSVYLVELPCNWRSIQTFKTARELPWPQYETITETGLPVCSDKLNVFLSHARLLEIDVSEMRDWTKEFMRSKFKMFHRFRYECRSVRVHKDYLGITARFTHVDDALYFKMFWY